MDQWWKYLHVTHLGVYGDVQRVKILYNKKDSALIQMAEPQQGHLGKQSMGDTTLTMYYFYPLLYVVTKYHWKSI